MQILKVIALVILLASSSLAQTRQRGTTLSRSGPTDTSSDEVVNTIAAPSWVFGTLATWLLDEASGPRVNAQGTASRDLTVVGTVTQDTSIKMEGVASVNFAGGSNRLEVVDAAISALAGAMSVGCWLRPSVAAANQFIRHLVAAGNNAGFLLNLSATPASQFNVGGAGALKSTGFGPAITVNSWVHVVGVYDVPTVRFYQNGVEAATTNTSASMTATTDPFMLSSVSFPMNGRLDECFLHAAALSPAAVCRICSCGLRGEQCTCSGNGYASTGRNAVNCNSCTLPTNCAAAAPTLRRK